jgi:hypothetical protein
VETLPQAIISSPRAHPSGVQLWQSGLDPDLILSVLELSLPFSPFISSLPLASSFVSPFGSIKAKLKLSQSIVVVLQATQNAIVFYQNISSSIQLYFLITQAVNVFFHISTTKLIIEVLIKSKSDY